MAANTPELFELHYAVPLTGAVLNTINTRLEPETVAYILDHSDARLVIADTAFSAVIQKAFDLNDKALPVVDIVDADGPGGTKIGSDRCMKISLLRAIRVFTWRGPEDEWHRAGAQLHVRHLRPPQRRRLPSPRRLSDGDGHTGCLGTAPTSGLSLFRADVSLQRLVPRLVHDLDGRHHRSDPPDHR